MGDEAGQVNEVYMTEGLGCLPEGIGVYPEVIWAVKWERKGGFMCQEADSGCSVEDGWVEGTKLEVHGVQVRVQVRACAKEGAGGWREGYTLRDIYEVESVRR